MALGPRFRGDERGGYGNPSQFDGEASTSPALAAGVTDKLREMSDVVTVLEAWEKAQ